MLCANWLISVTCFFGFDWLRQNCPIFLKLDNLCILTESLVQICNSNWTEWSTIQGIIGRVISNYEHDFSLNCTTRGPITN